MNSLWLAEIKKIFQSRKKRIEVIAIMLIPILYAGMFIWSFWDPYGNLEKLPIAIVNEDKGATLNGKSIEIGNKLVHKLKDEENFNYHFVDKKTAYKDLKNNKYYMIIEIPNNFSKDATTLMNSNPQKLQLNYIQNQAMNYTSSKIEESAMEKIKAAISKDLVATYSEEMLKNMKKMANGYKTASNGAATLSSGTVKVHDGVSVLRKGADQLYTGVIHLNDGITQVNAGAKQLNNGTNQLYTGALDLNKGSNEVNSGAQTLKNHLHQLASNSITFSNGISDASTGANQLVKGTTSLSSGLHQLSSASDQLATGAGKLQAGANQLSSGSTELKNGLQQADSQIPKLVSGTSQAQAAVKEIQQQLPEKMAKQISGNVTNSESKLNDGITKLQAGIAQQIVEQQQEQVAKMVDSLNLPEDQKSQMKAQLLKSLPTEAQVNEQLSPAFSQFKQGVQSTLTQSTSGMEEQIQQAIDPSFNQLSTGLATINQNQETLQQGIHQLSQGANQLNSGITQLENGQNSYVQNMKTFNEKLAEANSGANQLQTGASQLATGLGQLNSGSSQLVDGTKQLAAGSNNLANGTSQLATGSSDLVNGAKQVTDGSNDLANGTGQLTSGSTKLVDGTKQLANGSTDLSDGTKKLQDGSKALQDKLSDAANKSGDIHANHSTYNTMGDPVKLNQDAYTKVPNYGTGLTPYFLSLGLFVGALLLTIVYNIKNPVTFPKNGFSWYLGKFGVMAFVGIIQSLIADFILLVLIHVNVQSVPLFVLATIITSLTYMAIIQFLVGTLGNPGRYIAIIILILQLTTSAGTFPLELIPNALHPIHQLMPMTYSLQMFKAVVSSGDFTYMWENMGMLFIYLVIFVLLTLTFFVVKFKQSDGKLALETVYEK